MRRKLLSNLRTYLSGEQQGVGALNAYVTGVTFSCFPKGITPKFILVGYSQGAMVVHDYLRMLANAGATNYLKQIAGVGLVADPERTSQSNVVNLGSASSDHYGLCRLADVTKLASCRDDGKTTDLPNGLRNVWALCDDGDIVCDTSSLIAINTRDGYETAVKSGVFIHTHNYPDKSGFTVGMAIGRRLKT